MCECENVRELTISEEIKSLDIEENTRRRILDKVNRFERECGKQNDYLMNCHIEIERLKGAIVEQAKMISRQADEIRNRGIS